MSKFFTKKTNASTAVLNDQIDALHLQLENNGAITPSVSKSVMSLESLEPAKKHSLEQAADSLRASLESVSESLNISRIDTNARDHGAKEAALKAGVIAGLLAADFKGYLASTMTNDFNVVSTESMGVVGTSYSHDSVDKRTFALEAYDERNNRSAVVYSMAFNQDCARQNEFNETFWPTIVVTNDNVGFGISVNLMLVFSRVTRDISGSVTEFNKKNIIRAVADPTILHKEETKIFPVVRVASEPKFIDPAIVAPQTIIHEGVSITTAPIAVGKKIDLLAISQTDALLATGVQDNTDSIDPTISLKNVYVKIGDDVLKLSTLNLPLSNFVASPQNNYRIQNLAFTTTSVLINKDTKQADGSPLVTLAPIVTGDLIVRLELQMNGSVNIETGETVVFGNLISTYTVSNSSGDLLDKTAAPAAPVVALIDAGTIEGYDLDAWRTNMNRRQQGQFIDTTTYTQMYNVPMRSPITAIHPVVTNNETDTSDLLALQTTVRVRLGNEGVTQLLNTAKLISEYVDVRDVNGVSPEILGVGRFYVRPVYYHEIIDMNLIVDSLTSTNRPEDIQNAIVNKIRDYAFRMYTESEYQAAAEALNGGIAPQTTIIIGTDPIIARYLMITGDLRTMSGFDHRIVSSLDIRMRGKVVISFGVFDENRNTVPNPLNFGNMAWMPEVVLTANLNRNGQYSKETVVQPRYTFVANLPVMTVLEINGIPDTINKLPLLTHNI